MNCEFSILKVLVYFDIFRYPLTKEEVYSYLDHSYTNKIFQATIDQLITEKKIFKLDKYYSLQNDISLVNRRNTGNENARLLLLKAEKIARLIYKFPFVRAVGISGSVSKNFADELSDIDYFVITKAHKLWIARTFLHLYRKLPFVKNRNQHYCMNYFVDEANMVIAEQNIYTATELYTLIPIAGNDSMKNFFECNSWSYDYLPNKNLPAVADKKLTGRLRTKKIIEWLFSNHFGEYLDNYLMRLTKKRWKKKQDEGRLNIKGERMGFDIGKHFCKPSIIFFHNWFMTRYEKKLEETGKKWREKIGTKTSLNI